MVNCSRPRETVASFFSKLAPLAFALILPFAALAEEGIVTYTDTNSIHAQKVLEKLASRDPALLKDAERAEWARARLAWVALLRLEGKEEEASKVLEGCAQACRKWGPEKEWLAAKDWACRRSPQLKICG